MAENQRRIEALKASLSESNLDAAAFIPGSTFRYLTGGVFHLMERPTVFIVPRSGKPAVILPDLEAEAWAGLGLDVDVIRWTDEEGYAGAFRKAAQRVPAARIGVEGLAMRVTESKELEAAYGSAEIVDIQPMTLGMRAVKQPAELVLVRQAVAMAETAMRTAVAEVELGMSEKQVQRLIMRKMIDLPIQGPISPPTVLAGPNSAQPHGHAGDYKTKAGDALLIDFGVGAGGYRSDITRTFFIREVSDEDRALYECVLAANTHGRKIARPGMQAHTLDDEVRGSLERSAFAEFVVHKTGHGLGLDVHEAPQIMRGNHVELAPGNVITIEPGLYRTGRIGVRIEDDVLITDDGCESLSVLPRDLTVIG